MINDSGIEERNAVSGAESSFGQKRVLLLVGYSYFFENFFSKVISSFRGEWTFDVWFDSHSPMFSQGDYESARSLQSSGPFGQIRCFPLSLRSPQLSLETLREWLTRSRSEVERLKNLAASEGYSAVITMNSSLLSVLPLVSALKGLGLKMVVLRASIPEAPLLRLLRPFFELSPPTSPQIPWGRPWAVSRFVAAFSMKALIEAIRFFSRKNEKKNHANLRLRFIPAVLSLLMQTPIAAVGFLFTVFGVKRPLKVMLEAEYAFASSSYTDFVITPGTAHLDHMRQFFRGPQYLAYGSFFESSHHNHRKSEKNLNILLPLHKETSLEAATLLGQIVSELMRNGEWTSVRYRLHPRELESRGNFFLQELIAKIPCPTKDVSEFTFADFSSLDGRFLVVGSSSAITSLSLFSPGAEIGVLSIDRGREPGEDGRYLEGFGNSCLLRAPADVEGWLRNRSSRARNSHPHQSLERVFRGVLEA